MPRRRHERELDDGVPLEPLGRSSGVAGGYPPTPTAGEQRGDPPADASGDEWTWDTFPFADILAASWNGMVNPPAEEEDVREDTWDVRRYADPVRALWVVLLLGLLFWIFPQNTLAALGWTWRHTLGYPFQASHTSLNASVSTNLSVPACVPLPISSYKMPWQKEFSLPSHRKGVYLVTSDVEAAITEGLRGTQIGLLHLFIKHTSASLALGENWDSDVRSDMDRAMDHIVPESGTIPWDHIDEGTSLLLSSLRSFVPHRRMSPEYPSLS